MGTDTGYETETRHVQGEEYLISFEGESLSFSGPKMRAFLQKSMAGGAGVHIGVGVYAQKRGGYVTCTIGEGHHPIQFDVSTAKKLVEYLGESNATGDNDPGKSGKAEYLTMDSAELAKEIVADSPTRGISLAFAILRESGWGSPDLSTVGKMVFSLSGLAKRDKLQPESPVDTKPGQSDGGRDEESDPWARFG